MTKTLKVTLSTPDVAKSGGMTGKWTMIYDQGFQISIGGNTYFAFSQYDISKAAVGSDDEKVTKAACLPRGYDACLVGADENVQVSLDLPWMVFQG